MSLAVSAQRRQEIIDALRRGTVPARSLDAFAVGLDRFEPAVDEELALGARGGSVFKAVRGEYGSGKTFFARWLTERAKKANFATAEIQISETETPLHRLETVYRRIVENLATPTTTSGALRDVVDGWFYFLDQDAGDAGLVVVLDEVETLQRMRTDVREKSLNALRQLLDEIDGGRFPGLYLVVTGTPAFFDGQQGVQRLPPLAQRLQTDFRTEARF